MLRLLNIEFHKLRYNRAAKVLSIIYFVLICFLALIASIEFRFGGEEIQVADLGIFNFPYIWHFNSYFAAWLKIFLAVVIVSMISNEYTNRTLKQNLIDGMGKKEFILSKFYTVIVFSLVSTLFLFVVSLILGLIFSDYNDFSIIFSDLEYLLAYFVKLLGFFSFCLFLGMLLKRSAFALGFLAVWWIFEGIVHLVLRALLPNNDTADQIVAFFPLKSMANLIIWPIPRLDIIQSALEKLEYEYEYAVHFWQVLIVLVWTAVFIYFSYALLKKRDL
jgi:ABC-type transport system involved in multi-copper enzyme maturation permease subunit